MSTYTLKTTPNDFIVNEIPLSFESKEGSYALIKVKKYDFTTQDVIAILARFFQKKTRDIGFAGNKDKIAITTQYMTIKHGSKDKIEQFSHKDITLEFKGYISHPLSLGDLQGNSFIVTIRDAQGKPQPVSSMINFFGEQRFSSNNASIGKMLLCQDFKNAYEALCKGNNILKKDQLENESTDFVKALSSVPLKTLQLFVHSYQSYLWNKAVSKALELYKELPKNEMPLLGFETEIEESPYKDILFKLLEEEHMTQRQFIVPSFKQLSLGGSFRKIIVSVSDINIEKKDDSTYVAAFSLPKGSYATEYIKQLFTN